MSSKGLRYLLAAGLTVMSVLAVEPNPVFAQSRADVWNSGPQYRPGNAYDIVAPGMYMGDYSGPPIFVPGRGIINEPCGLPTSACSNAERGAD